MDNHNYILNPNIFLRKMWLGDFILPTGVSVDSIGRHLQQDLENNKIVDVKSDACNPLSFQTGHQISKLIYGNLPKKIIANKRSVAYKICRMCLPVCKIII